ncbi:hypothetical protein FOZ63_008818 [Perkinsus olseni]|uniref:Uncharacterized protein n=1 Tax=Perkinsus olseni TaxID=32597 RepID=A0A7J6UNH7_PEROL|nr:hypothetical protein FOZ62_014038 [Perkinsus olseni]KAF4758824.1 hypothetical protein FOZ63_008818 [Perkinsus olseni]
MSSIALLVGRMVIAIQMGLLALEAPVKPSGKYCGKVSFLAKVTLTFHGDTFDFDGRYGFSTGKADDVPYKMNGATTILIPTDNPKFQTAFKAMDPPFPASDLKQLGYANNAITAHTSLGDLTLANGKC